MKIHSMVRSQHVRKNIFDILMFHSTHLALVPVHPVLGSDAGEGHLIYLPDESENIKFSAVAYALPHIDGTEYV